MQTATHYGGRPVRAPCGDAIRKWFVLQGPGLLYTARFSACFFPRPPPTLRRHPWQREIRHVEDGGDRYAWHDLFLVFERNARVLARHSLTGFCRWKGARARGVVRWRSTRPNLFIFHASDWETGAVKRRFARLVCHPVYYPSKASFSPTHPLQRPPWPASEPIGAIGCCRQLFA